MKRFVKYNLLLLIVLGLSVAGIIALLVITVMDYMKMQQYISQTRQLRSEIQNLIRKTPAPVEGNIPKIEIDVKLYSKAAEDLRRGFGHPFQPALDRFFAVLRTQERKPVSQAEFTENFFNIWNAEKTVYAQVVAYKNFQRNFVNWGEAMQEFRNLATRITTEPVTDNSIDDIFLSSIGVPRRMNGEASNLLRFMTDYQRTLVNLAKDKVTFDSPLATSFSFVIPTATTTGSANSNYLPDEYPMIAQHFEIIGDIVKRSIDAGITSFIDFRRRDMQPEDRGGFQVYHYSIELTGSLESIRKLSASLDQAYLDNRMYVIRSIFLYQDNDPAQALLAPEEIRQEELLPAPGAPTPFGPPPPQRPTPRPRPGRPGRNQPSTLSPQQQAVLDAENERLALEELEKNLPYNFRPSYGQVVAGGGLIGRAIIDVEYVMESGN